MFMDYFLKFYISLILFQACTAWEYDHSTFDSTIITDFDLVCENGSMKNFAQSIFFGGLMIGVFISGWVSDFFGRKPTLSMFQ